MTIGYYHDGGSMATLELTQTQSLQTRQELKLIFRLEQANLLEMPEEDFRRLIGEVESSPLFRRLYRKEKLIRYQRFPRTDLSSSFYPLKEEMVVDKGSLDVESLLLNKEHVVGQIQKLGLEKFRQYFLYPDESELTMEEIAQECDLDVTEVQEVESLINEFSILSEFYNPSALGPEQGVYYTKVASVERGPEGFVLGYYSPSFARGRYSINYERFEELKKSGIFGDNEAKEAKQLFRKLELINTRKDTITQVLQGVVEKQALYFESGDPKALLPFSQKELARRIGLAPSSVSRAIRGRSIVTPWGAEVPLKRFFPRPREFRKELLRHLLETDKGLSSDETIRSKLWEKLGVSISRRSVANLRKELKFPPAQGK
jgi:DNA-directed RNA polymerase specialized sigma54-like protein